MSRPFVRYSKYTLERVFGGCKPHLLGFQAKTTTVRDSAGYAQESQVKGLTLAPIASGVGLSAWARELVV